MNVAFPVTTANALESLLGEHFGRSPFFVIYNTETKDVRVIKNAAEHFGGAQATPSFLKEQGVNVLVCKALGRKAITLFDQLAIGVFLTERTIVKEALEDYLAKRLRQATRTDGCSGGEHHH